MASGTEPMDTRSTSLCLWSGYAFFPLYLIGFVGVAGFLPAIPPNWDAAQLAAFFEQHRMSILIGMSISVIASALYVPWSVAISGLMARVESGFPVLGQVQMISGGVGGAFFMISPMIWLTMVYRGGHSADTLLILNDFAWISWIISWPFFFVQIVAFGLCALLDKADTKVIPRWAGYLACWSAVSMIPASLVAFFQTGPFAWNGLISLYLPLALYAIWFHAVFYLLVKAPKRRSPLVPVARAAAMAAQ